MNHKARKRFGQNFLQDQAIIDEIMANIQLQSDEHAVEIGPGMGALTRWILETGCQLDVIELDRDLVNLLKDRFRRFLQLNIHSADALQFDFSALKQSERKLRLIGNLPYNISSPLLFHLMSQIESVEDMHFMLQKEVVDRMCASPGCKQYGRLSIMIQYYCQAERVCVVPPESFDPAPKVMSAVIKLTPHPVTPVEVDNISHLNYVVTTAFSQRRKTIRNSLKKIISEEQIISLDIDPGLRAESLSLSDFARLSQFIDQQD